MPIIAPARQSYLHFYQYGELENEEEYLPVMVFVDGKSTSDERGAEDWCVGNDELPECWVVI